MNQSEIKEKLAPVFKEVFEKEIEITPELTANDVANWDSLTHMVLITTIEERFGVKFTLRDLNKMKNVGVLMQIIEKKLS